MPLAKKTPNKASDQIRAEVSEQISQGTLLPGDSLDEAEIARRYGVSKTPVREALLQLKAQGLLTSLPRGGMVVSKMDLRQLLSLWELLAEIESVAARLACERMSADELKSLVDIHKKSSALAESENWNGWKKANQQFHEIIYNATRNPYLRQEVLRIRARTGVYRMHAFGALGRIHSSFEQHDQIVQALQRRDAQGAATAMVRHILPASNANSLTNFLMNIPKDLLA